MWRVTLATPWLEVAFPAPHHCLSWAPRHGGAVIAPSVLWREVRDADLTLDLDVPTWIEAQTTAYGHPNSPCFLTSRQIATYCEAEAEVEGIRAKSLATAGLGNAERIGQRRQAPRPVGTINLLVQVSVPLSLPAQLEAMSLMAEARTAAMLDWAPKLWPHAPTGTGTDCLCLASPLAGLEMPEAVAWAMGIKPYESTISASTTSTPPPARPRGGHPIRSSDAEIGTGTETETETETETVQSTGSTACQNLMSPALGDTSHSPKPHDFAGKHTALGEVIGRVAYDALAQAIRNWSPPA